MAVAPPLTIEAQPRVALPYGLFSVLTPRGSADVHWQNGLQWEALSCAPAGGLGSLDCERAQVGLPKDLVEGAQFGTASEFTIYGSHSCTLVGSSPERAQSLAMLHLLAREEARVEQAIWTGDLGTNEFTTNAEEVGTGQTPALGVGLLEDWLAVNYGSLGVLHMTRSTATVLLKEGVLTVRSNGLYTVLGTPVVAGGGYPGTSPAGTDPNAGTAYVYATPALLGYRSDPFPAVDPPSAGFDLSRNDIHAVAERTYAVGWDPCGTAVVSITLPTTAP